MLFKKKELATNEFNQVVQGTSLTKEAWKRLKKNKMAVLGLVVVIIYALLAACASLLPLYPYDEIILDHQNFRPSLTKNAGDLMMEAQLKDLYFDAWRSGELVVGEEADEKINQWIDESKTNNVWNYLLEEGERQRESGEFTFNKTAQRKIDRIQTKIDTEIQTTLNKIYYTDENGKKTDLAKADYLMLRSVYANWLKVSEDLLQQTVDKELSAQIRNNISETFDEETTDEDIAAAIALEIEAMGESGYEELARENVYGKIEAQAKRDIEKSIKNQMAEGTLTLPIKGEFKDTDTISADLKATMKHQRRYFLGTDDLGRCLLSRIIYGGQVSIAIGLIGTITSVLIGILVGAIAGYKGGKIDYYLMRFVDVMYGLPYMLLVIICMAIFGRKIQNLFFALALVSWLTIARVVRGQIMSLKNQEYVEAARSMGASTAHIILKHMIPNSLSVIIVYSTIRIPSFIMQESFLSFLGLGVQAPFASWGSLIGDAVASMTLYPWKLLCPSIVMIVFLFAMNFLGDGLRDAFDPQSKNQM